MADWLAVMAGGKKGNYLAFFPSYRMMLDVYDIFEEKYGDCVAEKKMAAFPLSRHSLKAFAVSTQYSFSRKRPSPPSSL